MVLSWYGPGTAKNAGILSFFGICSNAACRIAVRRASNTRAAHTDGRVRAGGEMGVHSQVGGQLSSRTYSTSLTKISRLKLPCPAFHVEKIPIFARPKLRF